MALEVLERRHGGSTRGAREGGEELKALGGLGEMAAGKETVLAGLLLPEAQGVLEQDGSTIQP